MVFPIGDDNTGRVRNPYVTYVLIALNVLVFVFLQGMGTNERFTYAFSTVPQEIRTGADVAREVPVELGDEHGRSEEHTSELQSLAYLVCRLLLEKKKKTI